MKTEWKTRLWRLSGHFRQLWNQ